MKILFFSYSRDLDKPDAENESKKAKFQNQVKIPLEEMAAPAAEVEVKTERNDDAIGSSSSNASLNPRRKKEMKKECELSSQQEAQTKSSIKDINAMVNSNPKLVRLRVENLIMMHEIDELEKKLNNSNDVEAYQQERLTVQKLAQNEVLLHCYTGLTSYSVFRFLMYAVSEAESDLRYSKWSVVNLRLEEQMLITLMKLRCNFGFSDIAFRFRVSSSTVKNIIWTFVDGLHSIFYEEAIAKKPLPYFIGSAVALPEEFANFSNCRILLRCVEVESEASRHSTASDYKQRTLRGLVGVSPLGDFIFASELYPEVITLREMVQISGLLEKLSPGDLILSLEKLNIDDLLPQNVDLNVPLLTQDDASMNEKKILADITKATQILDRAVEKLRRYAILDRILLSYRVNASKIFQLCCALVNLESSMIEES